MEKTKQKPIMQVMQDSMLSGGKAALIYHLIGPEGVSQEQRNNT